MRIELSEHFTCGKLLRFTLPSIAMMIFNSLYGVVDGIFVSNFAGKVPFAAVNLIMPYMMMLGTVGFMVGTGGTALISKTMGMGDRKKANEIFSMLTWVCIFSGGVLTAAGLLLLRPAAVLLGATGEMLDNVLLYGRIVIPATTAYILQFAFQSFCVTAEKAKLSLVVAVSSGVCNMVLDALFVAVFRWGLVGAAAATAIAQYVGAVIPLVYFGRRNNSLLRLGKFRFDGKALLRTCTNGSSELMSNLSMNLVGMLYNVQLLRFAGEDGIAAYGVIMYVNFIFISAFLGFSIGTAPLIGYNYGAQDHRELQSLVKKSLGILLCFSVLTVVLAVSDCRLPAPHALAALHSLQTALLPHSSAGKAGLRQALPAAPVVFPSPFLVGWAAYLPPPHQHCAAGLEAVSLPGLCGCGACSR
jgi:putative MATE family efflux protein